MATLRTHPATDESLSEVATVLGNINHALGGSTPVTENRTLSTRIHPATDETMQEVVAKLLDINDTLNGNEVTPHQTPSTRVHPMTDESLQDVVSALTDIEESIGTGGLLVGGTIYGFHMDSSESDPYACVTYLKDAVGMTPAAMNYGTGQFDYGSWENAFFMPRPCMLKYDGTVDYYLDPTDYSKKEDGTASDVANVYYGGNAMMEWGRDGKIIWYKVVPDKNDDTSFSAYFANRQVDDGYVCWPFINGDGDIVDHFYTPIYNGTIVDNRLRSISGLSWSTYGCKSKTAAQERTLAKANNPSGMDIWDTERYCDVILINPLLTLIGKSLDTQTTFGQGLHESGTSSYNDSFITGTHDSQGLFYGTDSGSANSASNVNANAVKVFGMENWWGFQSRRFVGLWGSPGTTNNEYTVYYKLTKGTEDGSTASDYAVGSSVSGYTGYIVFGAMPTVGNTYAMQRKWNSDGVYIPSKSGGSSSTYYCDGVTTGGYACHGGDSNDGSKCGAWYLGMMLTSAYWYTGAAISCKPQKIGA